MTDDGPQESALTKALAEVQQHLPKVDKNATNPHYKSKYADLSEVSSKILSELGKNGLAWITKPTLVDGQLVLMYKLRHIAGETEEGVFPLVGANIQQQGSAITYARRYCLCAVVGVAAEEDDDGQAASIPPKQRRQQQLEPEGNPGMPPSEQPVAITPAQLAKLKIVLGELGLDRDAGLEFYERIIGRHVDSSKQLTKKEASQVIDALVKAQEAGVKPDTGEIEDATLVD